MKKQIMPIFIVIILLMLTACNNIDNELPYTLKSGTYDFRHIVIKDLATEEMTIKDFDDILFDREQFEKWGDFLRIYIGINENTSYHVDDGRMYVIYDGTLYEIVADNLLSLHIPYFESSDNKVYDIVIFFGWSKNYL